MKTFLFIFFVLTIFCSCENSNTENEAQKSFMAQAKIDSTKAYNDYILQDSIEAKKNRDVELAKLNVEKLVKKFKYKKDKFSNKGWYEHPFFNVYNILERNCLIVNVSNSGWMYLESQYTSSSWIFHNQIKVKVGKDIYETSVIETFDKNNKHQNSSGSVWENISFVDGSGDKIIKAISENIDEEVSVRYLGRDFYKDVILSKKNKEAIKDCYELSSCLSLLN